MRRSQPYKKCYAFFKIEEKLVLLNYTIASSEAIFVQF